MLLSGLTLVNFTIVKNAQNGKVNIAKIELLTKKMALAEETNPRWDPYAFDMSYDDTHTCHGFAVDCHVTFYDVYYCPSGTMASYFEDYISHSAC